MLIILPLYGRNILRHKTNHNTGFVSQEQLIKFITADENNSTKTALIMQDGLQGIASLCDITVKHEPIT